MNAADYQKGVARTMRPLEDHPIDGRQKGLLNYALGMAGEAGEAADLVKKHVFHQHPLDQAKLGKEIGDVLWYATALALEVGYPLEAVMEANLAKLRARYPEGFDAHRSINRSAE